MSHHHNHGQSHEHARHAHGDAPRRVFATPEVPGSLLRSSAGGRLVVAAAVVTALWAGVLWVVA